MHVSLVCVIVYIDIMKRTGGTTRSSLKKISHYISGYIDISTNFSVMGFFKNIIVLNICDQINSFAAIPNVGYLDISDFFI